MKWRIKSKSHINQESVDQIINILLKNRGVITKKQQKEFIHPTLAQLDREFFDKKSLKKAHSRIAQAIKKNEHIIIYSDYDVDGITGSAILWETLHALKANVMPFVPDRFRHGYGLSKNGIADILEQFPDTKLIITVDNGITAAEEVVAALHKKGIDVIISDHHTVPKKKPKAYAIIHTTELSGSGVAYVFSKTIQKYVNLSNHQSVNSAVQQDNDEHLELAALGTIADLVPLIGSNRIIAKYGLSILNKTKRIGLKALFDICGLSDQLIEAYQIGYVIGPRINASGRLAQGLYALQLLCTNNAQRASQLAHQLNELNTSRQDTTKKAFEHASHLVTDETTLIFVSHETYHEGVIGLIAGNLVDKFYRPAIVVSIGKTVSKASARSIRGVNIYTLLQKALPHFENFGGHPMAAGFSIRTDKLKLVEKELHKIFTQEVSSESLLRSLSIDFYLPLELINQNLYDAISQMKPFGMGNPEPVFLTENVKVLEIRVVGKNGDHLKLKIESDSMASKKEHHKIFDGIGFNLGNEFSTLKVGKRVNIVYSIMENEWNGSKSLQLKVKDIKMFK